MSDITDPRAINFCNNRIRPAAERLRALAAEYGDLLTEWYGGMNGLIPNDASPVIDGRTAEGISHLTGADINGMMGVILTINNEFVTVGVKEVIQKPCVRPLSAS